MSRLRILVAGMIAGDPYHGGAVWAVLQYVLGLRRLGHEVWLVEPVDELTPGRVRYFAAVATEFELTRHAALLCDGDSVGVPHRRLVAVAGTADVLLNVSGMLADERILAGPRQRVWLDLDPGFNQLWHEDGIDMRFAAHDRFVTVGQRLGRAGCDVPTCGRDWKHTLPPVILDRWPRGTEIVWDGLTTVASWRSYGTIHHRGRRYGQKAHSVRALIALPGLTSEPIMPALAIDPGERDDLHALASHGWRLLDPGALAATPSAYRAFVRGSKGELGIAKEGYAVSQCGWFSDRSACYLAAGRPVVAQNTGLGDALPTGEGFLTFDSDAQAAFAIDQVRSDYRRHAGAAREIAEAFLDSDRVLTGLLEAL